MTDRLREERFTVLQMVQDGTITPDDGARLLEAMDRAERTRPVPAPPAPPTSKSVRFVIGDGQDGVDITLPYSLVELGLNIANKFAPGRVPETTEIRKSIQGGFTGPLLNIGNGQSRIQIIVEETKE